MRITAEWNTPKSLIRYYAKIKYILIHIVQIEKSFYTRC